LNHWTTFHLLPPDQLSVSREYEILRPSSLSNASNPSYLAPFIRQSQTGRINLWSPDLTPLTNFREPSHQTYSWLLLIEEKSRPSFASKASPLSPEVLPHTELDPATRASLESAWRDDYLKGAASPYSQEIRDDIWLSYATTLSEGTHLLYRRNDKLIGHAAYVTDVQEILGIENYYLHIWVDRREERSVRSSIHADFFSRIRAMDRPGMAGISVLNQPSLSLFLRNGYVPKLLSISRFD
jgi:hypothetical protein